MHVYSRYSYRKRELGHLIGLTDSFSWEELPTRDPHTGYLTKAGYIRLIPSLTKYITASAIVFNGTQSLVRIVLNQDMMFTTWYPFDVSASPAYEIANFTQVKFSILSVKLNCIQNVTVEETLRR
jgi:hypothetical protein